MLDVNRPDLVNEQARERRYQEALQARHERPVAFEASRNQIWTESAKPSVGAPPVGELIGRVRLREPNEAVLNGASEFYIGYGHVTVDGVDVYSWAAPVACTFFNGDTHHILCGEVALTRTFEHRERQITSYEDQQVDGLDAVVEFSRPTLTITRRPGGAAPRSTEAPAASSVTGAVKSAPQPPKPRTPTPRPAAPLKRTPARTDGIRAPELLQRQLRADRTGTMQSVLATLQPDQYALITRSAATPLVVDGHPGSGKTIIAVHRAAFLAGPQEGGPPAARVTGDVLLVGPTVGYVRHVSRQVAQLLPENDRIRVMTIGDVLLGAAGLAEMPQGSDTRSAMDVAADLAVLVDRVIQAHGETVAASSAGRASVAEVYEQLRAADSTMQIDAAWRPYLQRLPEFEVAATRIAHLPLLAYIGARLKPSPPLMNLGHVVVDEAQDVTRLEWLTLKALNKGTWTLVGDMNQRRASFTVGTWSRTLSVLGISGSASRSAVVALARGYRSTKPIIEFADQLLDSRSRRVQSLQQDGAPVRIVKVTADAVSTSVVDEAVDLAQTGASVAIISVSLPSVRTELRRRGWVAERGDVSTWSSSWLRIMTQRPDDARGLEFDGVVVQEPSEILAGLHETGRLYTSLTRANRELRIVHAEPLPAALRTPVM